jgi:hypothetical protein
MPLAALGILGLDQVAKSMDGHSLGVMFQPHAVLPAFVGKKPARSKGHVFNRLFWRRSQNGGMFIEQAACKFSKGI